jgi:hypothetical protein
VTPQVCAASEQPASLPMLNQLRRKIFATKTGAKMHFFGPSLHYLCRYSSPPRTTGDEMTAQGPDVCDYTFHTSGGSVTFRAWRYLSPAGADRLHNLARLGFYNSSPLHRVLPGFVAQWVGLVGCCTHSRLPGVRLVTWMVTWTPCWLSSTGLVFYYRITW